jgi:hypothetical protein
VILGEGFVVLCIGPLGLGGRYWREMLVDPGLVAFLLLGVGWACSDHRGKEAGFDPGAVVAFSISVPGS